MADVRWKVVVYAGRDGEGRGRQRTRSGYAKNEREAKKAREAARVKLRAEIDAGREEQRTLAGLCDAWMLTPRVRAHATTTRYVNQLMLNRVKADQLGRTRLDKLTARDLDHFYARLLDGDKAHPPVSRSTANHYHRLLHAVLRQGHKWGQVPGNVADLASPPTKTRDNADAHTTPTPAALIALIDSAAPSLKMAAQLAAATGCRRGELVALLWSDVDGDILHVRQSLAKVPGSPVEIKRPKSGVTRRLEVDDDTLVMLDLHRRWLKKIAVERGAELAENGPVLANMRADPTGQTPYPPGWITLQWVRLCKRFNVKFRFHDLRHFHATQLIAAKVEPATVSQRLGHSKISTTTDIYTHALKESDHDAALAIGRVLARPETPAP